MPQRGAPAWGYHDLVLFLSAVLPSLALSAALLRVTLMVAPVLLSSDAARTLVRTIRRKGAGDSAVEIQ